MTNGSSQGLFVIVVVVIFGIFVVISYLLFRDKLQTGLASIFDDSITEARKGIDGWTYLNFTAIDSNDTFISSVGNTYTLTGNGNHNTNWVNYDYPKGFSLINKGIVVPYGYKLTISYFIQSPVDAIATTDYNAKTDSEDSRYMSGNDIYSQSTASKVEIKAGQMTEVTFSYTNKHASNKNKVDIFDYSTIGIEEKTSNQLNDNNQTYILKDIRYKLEKL